MPNRIIKESICTSDTIEQFTAFEETFFYRLIVNCDDYGRLDARPAILKAKLFPLKNVTEKQVDKALKKLSSTEVLFIYEFESRPYLQLSTWEKHQQIRAKRSKFPAYDSTCMQMISDDIRCHRNPIQSNPIRIQSESESNPASLPIDFFQNVINYLNEKAGTAYKATSQANKKHIQARFNEGFNLDDFKRVIDNKVKDWNHEPTEKEKDMRSYLRPQTLFGPNFESYLNSKPVKKAVAHRDNFEQRQYDDDFYDKLNQSTIIK